MASSAGHRLAAVDEGQALSGVVFDIKRFSVHDGPGVRTTVFLKGCSLHCVWCHNPEGVGRKPELFFYRQKCLACGACVEACPTGAQRIDPRGRRSFHRALCDACGKCVDACYAEALALAGKTLSVGEVMAVVREDAPFYRVSGGGVTLSGGEPLLQAGFTMALLRQCKTERFHTAVDTCGQAPWQALQEALPYVDLWLYDLKHTTQEQHRLYTGASNSRILGNLRRLGESGARIEIRIPVVPTVNDSQEFIEGAYRLLTSVAGIAAVRLLPYHRLAGSKYRALGLENHMPRVPSPTTVQMERMRDGLARNGLVVLVPEPTAVASRRNGQGDGP